MQRYPQFLLVWALAAPAAAQSLRQGGEEFAQAPVALDARLADTVCLGGYRYGWADAAQRAVEARCDATGRRLVLPLATGFRGEGPNAAPRLRRGEAVLAEARGAGFRVRVEAVAEGGGGADGAVSLKNSRTGQRFAGRQIENGRILVPQADGLP